MATHRPIIFAPDHRPISDSDVTESAHGQINDGLPDPVNAVQRTVRGLLKISMNVGDGDYIGSEADLQARLNISRPTFRQAAKIVQNDRFIEIRRGVNGGIFAARPHLKDVVQRPALYLRLAGADLSDGQQVSRLIAPFVTRTAAQNITPARKNEFLDLAAQCDLILTGTADVRDVIAVERIFAKLVATTTGNPMFGLFMGIMYEFGLWENNLTIYNNRPDRCAVWIEKIADHCRAIARGDADKAEALSIERSQIVSGWIANHPESAAPDDWHI